METPPRNQPAEPNRGKGQLFFDKDASCADKKLLVLDMFASIEFKDE
jgi:hypothetical protein